LQIQEDAFSSKKHGSMFEKQERKIIVFRLVQPSDMHFTSITEPFLL
jgi:hypothetical protein